MSRLASILIAFTLADIAGLLIGAVAAVLMTEAAGVPERHALALGGLVHFAAGAMIFLTLSTAAPRCRSQE